MKHLKIIIFLLGIFVCSQVWAVFVVKDIKVEGLNRISAGTVFNYLPVKVGDKLTKSLARKSIRSLFKTGFFNDIKFKQKGDVLIITVVERPSITKINIEGTKEISEDELRMILKEINLSEGRIFNRSLLEKIKSELKRQYFSRGKYSVKINTEVKEDDKNKVVININISEGKAAKIKQINIVGNSVFTDKKIVKLFNLSEDKWYTMSSSQYSKEKLIGDSERLRNYYHDRGYLEFKVESTQVSISPDKEDIYLTVNVKEGKKYTVGAVVISGKTIVPRSKLKELLLVKKGEVFSRKKVTKSVKSITDLLGKQGYAFANVNPVPDVNKKKGIVSFNFYIDPGKRVYVRRINFSGNIHTNDDVLRREMRILESSWYSPEKLNRSRVRLQKLGFFESVKVETPRVPGSSDQVDVNVIVKERPTGNLLFGIGYSDVDGVLVNAAFTENNLFGEGKSLTVKIDKSQVTKRASISYRDPYYTNSGVSRSLSVFYTEIDAEAANTAPFILSTSGAGVSYGFPTSETQSLRAGIFYEETDLTLGDVPSQISLDFEADHIAGHPELVHRGVKTTVSWAIDTLDSAIFPTKGSYNRLSLEYMLPGSELEYYRASYDFSVYFPVTEASNFRFKFGYDQGDGYGDIDELPFFKNYFAGGSNTIRGYKPRSLGPLDSLTGDPIGGSKRLLVNMEYFFKMPGSKEDNQSMRLSLFVDGGMVYSPDEKVDAGTLRYAGGLAFNWFSPVGPLSISYGIAINDEKGDETERVSFSLGIPLR